MLACHLLCSMTQQGLAHLLSAFLQLIDLLSYHVVLSWLLLISLLLAAVLSILQTVHYLEYIVYSSAQGSIERSLWKGKKYNMNRSFILYINISWQMLVLIEFLSQQMTCPVHLKLHSYTDLETCGYDTNGTRYFDSSI